MERGKGENQSSVPLVGSWRSSPDQRGWDLGSGSAESRGEGNVQRLEIVALPSLALHFQAFLQASGSKSFINAVSWGFLLLLMILAENPAGYPWLLWPQSVRSLMFR